MTRQLNRLLAPIGLWLLLNCGGSTSQVSTQPVPPTLQTPSHLGANLQMIQDWSFTPVYVDLMHQARKFGSPQAPWDENAKLGRDGWPTGDFGALLMIGARQYAGNAGIYKLSFSGKAKVANVASSAQVLNYAYDAPTNRSSADVVLDAQEDQLMLAFTETGPGIKDVKVIRPGYDAIDPPLFTTAFLKHIARFKTLRFMDWLRTNDNPVTSWKTRASPETTRYASNAGVPWEHIIALANQTGQDIWINIPIAADDDYVVQLAKLLKDSLRSESKVYVEYSNEIWNGGFGQFNTNLALALAQVKSDPASTLSYDGQQEPTTLAFRHVAKRLKEFSDIFRDVYGDAAMMHKIRPVLGFQVVQAMTAKIGLDYVDAVYGPPSRYFYAIAGAPYFDLGDLQTVDGLTADQVLQALGASVQRTSTAGFMEANVALATWFGLKFFAYEAGPATFGPGSIAAKKAANLDPRMYDLCLDYLSRWYRLGGDMLMWFMAGAGNWDTQYGTWELTTDLALPDTPKIKCMDTVLGNAPPSPTARNKIPGSFEALAFVGNQPPYSQESALRLRYLHPGAVIEYLLHAPESATYTLVIRSEAVQPGNSIEVAVNATVVDPKFALGKGGWGNPVDNLPIPVRLEKGLNTLRLTTRTENQGFILSGFRVY